MTRSTFLHAALWLVAVLATACGDAPRQAEGKATGAPVSRPYELLVVCSKTWAGTSAAEPLRTLLATPIAGLPRDEAQFRLTTVEPRDFDGTFLHYANVLRVDIAPGRKSEVTVQLGRWARTQVIVTLHAADNAAFAALVGERGEDVLARFNDAEISRAQALLRRSHSGLAAREARRQFAADLFMPADINAIRRGHDFFWASAEGAHENTLNVCMYAFTLPDGAVMDAARFAEKRDSVMRLNILGEPFGGRQPYMSTVKARLGARAVRLGGADALEVRGLWQMEYDAMGGPFVAYAVADTARRRVVVAEGFVYAPDHAKRPLIRQLEAGLKTLRIN